MTLPAEAKESHEQQSGQQQSPPAEAGKSALRGLILKLGRASVPAIAPQHRCVLKMRGILRARMSPESRPQHHALCHGQENVLLGTVGTPRHCHSGTQPARRKVPSPECVPHETCLIRPTRQGSAVYWQSPRQGPRQEDAEKKLRGERAEERAPAVPPMAGLRT